LKPIWKRGELRKHGLRLKLSDQPFQILAMLVARPGEVVSREVLRERLWPSDTFVDFDHGLNNAVMRLREVLGDSFRTTRDSLRHCRGGGIGSLRRSS